MLRKMEKPLTKLSSDDKYDPDGALQRLLDLDGEVMDQGEGFWVKIEAAKVGPDELRPHGISYSLCLFSPDDDCLLRFDNAHPIRVKRKMTETSDHVHWGGRVEPYVYSDPEELMSDFWEAVDEILRAKGVQQ
jgi:Family of unknown function (DUF6516)